MDNVTFERQYGDLTVHVVAGTGPTRRQHQAELLESGFPMPLTHRVEWAEEMLPDPTQSLFLAITDRSGTCRYGFGISRGQSRALPAHSVLRVERLRASTDLSCNRAAITGLRDAASTDSGVLRTHVELFSRDDASRAVMGRQLRRTGSRYVEQPSRCYRRTLVLDVTPAEDEIFRGLRSTARRYIRAVSKHPLRIGPIDDERYAPRIEALLRESFARTGGVPPNQDWLAAIDFSKRHPNLARLVGLFRTDDGSPESLLAFEWACAHGDHVEDVLAGATRPQDINISVAMPLVWDVVRWSKAIGTNWLDLGGVPDNIDTQDEHLRGITDFKLRFTQRVETVGEEWIYEPRPIRSRLARAIGSLARRIGAGHRALNVILPGTGIVAPLPF